METVRKNTFTKDERLCNKIEIESLFKTGNSLFVFPFKILYKEAQSTQKHPVKVLFSVPKRNFKRAVHRNLIRRRIKESYRLNKNSFYENLNNTETQISLMIIYVDKEIADYSKIEKSLKKGLAKLIKKLSE